MSKKLVNKILDKQKETNAKFIGCYDSYVTNLHENDIISAIKWFDNHYNATLYLIAEFNSDSKLIEIYTGETNDLPDVRGKIKKSYFNSEHELIYNQNDATPPIVKLNPTKLDSKCWDGWMDINGNFYKCGYQGHNYLADELFLSKTVPELTDIEKLGEYRNCTVLELRNWVKISNREILTRGRHITADQKKSLIKYVEVIGLQNIYVNGIIISIENFEDEIMKY